MRPGAVISDPRREGDIKHLREVAAISREAWVNASVCSIIPSVVSRLTKRGWVDSKRMNLCRFARLTDAGREALASVLRDDE